MFWNGVGMLFLRGSNFSPSAWSSKLSYCVCETLGQCFWNEAISLVIFKLIMSSKVNEKHASIAVVTGVWQHWSTCSKDRTGLADLLQHLFRGEQKCAVINPTVFEERRLISLKLWIWVFSWAAVKPRLFKWLHHLNKTMQIVSYHWLQKLVWLCSLISQVWHIHPRSMQIIKSISCIWTRWSWYPLKSLIHMSMKSPITSLSLCSLNSVTLIACIIILRGRNLNYFSILDESVGVTQETKYVWPNILSCPQCD